MHVHMLNRHPPMQACMHAGHAWLSQQQVMSIIIVTCIYAYTCDDACLLYHDVHACHMLHCMQTCITSSSHGNLMYKTVDVMSMRCTAMFTECGKMSLLWVTQVQPMFSLKNVFTIRFLTIISLFSYSTMYMESFIIHYSVGHGLYVSPAHCELVLFTTPFICKDNLVDI